MPFLVGFLIRTVNIKTLKPHQMENTTYHNRIYMILASLLGVAFISGLCELVRYCIIKRRSERVAKNIRYDLFYNYELKCTKVAADKKITLVESK